MFQKIYIEKGLMNSRYTQNLLERFKHIPTFEIDNYQDYFSRSKKPYLQKRDNLNLFIAQKKGQLVKLAPDAYGTKGEEHYYYVHAYNCIYECNYCYLQGYFHSPDIVLFANHEEIIAEINKTLKARPNKSQAVWFHAGEFSDTLALSHMTKELELYYEYFKQQPMAKWELRTKSVNIKEILALEPIPNMITSISMSPELIAKENDLKTPSTKARISALQKLQQAGHKIALHFDPIILKNNTIEQYEELLQELGEKLSLCEIEYISLGVVRFSEDVYQQVRRNYPETPYLHREFITAKDGKVKYPKPIRNWLLGKVKNLCLKYGIQEEKIYLCMEY